MFPEQLQDRDEERSLSPETALQALEDNSLASKIDVLPLKERHLPHSQAVEIDQREERPVAGLFNGSEEPLELELTEIARKALLRRWGQSGAC
jgi:hypothetical protein